jgi:hypothetical protein
LSRILPRIDDTAPAAKPAKIKQGYRFLRRAVFSNIPKPTAVINDQLQAVAPRICEEEGMSAGGIAFQPVAH